MAYQKYQKKAEVVRVPWNPSYKPSKEQSDINNCIRFDECNIHAEAGAGSGKSSTLIGAMHLSNEKNAAMMAFNTAIVQDILPKCPEHVVVKTAHSHAFASLRMRYKDTKLDDYKNPKLKGILEEYSWLNPDKNRNEKEQVIELQKDVIKLIKMIKVNLVDWTNREKVDELLFKYNIDIQEMDKVFDVLPKVFEKIIDSSNHLIDFDDMIWLPVHLGLPIIQYNMLYLDESQDFNRLMVEFAFRMAGDRVFSVGDRRQSIMGFAGADTKSIENIVERFGSTQFPLMTCYRCDKKIVEEANKIVPELRAQEGKSDGEVNQIWKDFDLSKIEDGSMILCRMNKGLVRPAFDLLKQGRKANIKGKDLGQGLIALIARMNCNGDIIPFLDAVESWRARCVDQHMKRAKPNMGAVDIINDQAGILEIAAEGCDDTNQLKNKINTLFAEETKGVLLSSIHKSKGLEADQVSIVDYSGVRMNHPKMTPEDHEQEANLNYVAITRAKHQLNLVY